MNFERSAGILLHPTSLPGKYGIGDLGKEAFKFIDFLIEAGQTLWQVFPLGPTGYGDSPYQCFSAFAGGSVQALVTTRTGDLVELSERGKAIGLLHTVGDFGSALGPVTAYALLRWITLNELYLLSAIIFIIGAGLALLMYIQQR